MDQGALAGVRLGGGDPLSPRYISRPLSTNAQTSTWYSQHPPPPPPPLASLVVPGVLRSSRRRRSPRSPIPCLVTSRGLGMMRALEFHAHSRDHCWHWC